MKKEYFILFLLLFSTIAVIKGQQPSSVPEIIFPEPENMVSVMSQKGDVVTGINNGVKSDLNGEPVITLSGEESIDLNFNTVDITGMSHIFMNVWLPEGAYYIGFYIHDDNGGKYLELDNGSPNSWNNLNIEYTGTATSISSITYTLGGNGDGTVVANIYFHNNILFEPPQKPAPSPSSPADDVKSIYSDSYPALASDIDDFGVTESVAENNYRRVSTFPAGVTMNATESIVNMTYFNINLWVSNAQNTGTITFLINDGSNDYTKTFDFAGTDSGIWKTIQIPVAEFSPSLNQIKSFSINRSGSEDVFIDNIYFSASYLPQPTGNILVSNSNSSSDGYYLTLFQAISNIKANDQTGKDIIIEVVADVEESRRSALVDGDWSSLTIKTDGNPRTVTFNPDNGYYNNVLFDIARSGNVYIDGTIGGDQRGLTLVGAYKVDADNIPESNTVIYINEADTIEIKNCIFKGGNTDRSLYIITAGGGNDSILIKNNLFENCMNLNHTDRMLSIVSASETNEDEANKRWFIEDNHFYETSPVQFTGAVGHSFISVDTKSENAEFTIRNNYIGGNAPNASGMLQASGNIGDIYGILMVNAKGSNNTYIKSSLIEANTIKNFNCNNTTNEILDLINGNWITVKRIGVFYGIRIENGGINVKENHLNNVQWSTYNAPEDNVNHPSGFHTLNGISLISESSSHIICDGNSIHNLRINILDSWNTGGETPANIMYNMIIANAMYGGKATIKNNRVVWGYDSSGSINGGGDISGISVSSIGNYGTKVDIYNNISVLEEFKLYDQHIWVVNLIKLLNRDGNSSGSGDEGGIINCYNNISYIQPRAADSFSIKDDGLIAGIGANIFRTSDKNSTNIFHNTVYINDFRVTTSAVVSSTALAVQFQEGVGSVNAWNNLLVNKADKSIVLYARDATVQQSIPGAFHFDYNTYYSKEYFGLVHEQQDNLYKLTSTFDEWKFDNKSGYFNRSFAYDHHSRCLDPLFSGTANASVSIDLSDVNNLENLRNLLKPYKFLGGCKTPDSILSTLLDNRSDATNTDFGLTPAIRRPYLPTMGAINTGFTDYWTGAEDNDWSKAANWANGRIAGDNDLEEVVFAPEISLNGEPICSDSLVLDKDRVIRDIYNDTKYHLNLNGKQLVVKGYIGQERSESNPDYAKINAAVANSFILFNGSGNTGSNAQHIFENTFTNNRVYNFTLWNYSDYFVLLHDKLDINNQLIISNPNIGIHKGGLNCIWYNTELKFSGNNVDANIPQHAIYNDSVYNLVINSPKVTTRHDDLYVKNNLNIGIETTDTDKIFEIAAGKLVKVDGLVTNNSGTTGLIIKSRVSESDSNPNATFISNPVLNNASNKIPATVEMFSPAKINNDGDYRWQYFTVPVEETLPVNADARLWNTWIRRWDPRGVNRDPYFGTPYWIYLENYHALSPIAGKVLYDNTEYGQEKKPVATTSYALQGYEITMDASRVIPFSGNLVNSGFSLTLDFEKYDESDPWTPNPGESWNEQTAMNGQYVVGNPYTAAIDIKALQFGQSLDPTVYIYNTGSYREWQSHNNIDSDNKYQYNPGQYLAVPWQLAGEDNLPSHISSMQGFLVMRNDDTGTLAQNTLTLDYNATETNKTIGKNTEIQRAGRIEQNLPHTVIDLDGEHYGDRLWIFINPECTKGYNSGWDGRKFATEVGPAQLFTVEDEEYYQVSTMDDIDKTYLGFKPGEKDSRYTLTFNHTDMDQEYSTIQLYDLIEGKVTDVTESGSTYSFEVTDHTYTGIRFMISTDTRNTTGDDNVKDINNKLDVYTHNNRIFIDNKTAGKGTAYIYDMSGRCLHVKPFEAGIITGIDTELRAGSYIVSLSMVDELINKSVILK